MNASQSKTCGRKRKTVCTHPVRAQESRDLPGMESRAAAAGERTARAITYMHTFYICMYIYVAIRPTPNPHKPTASEQQTFWPTHPHPESSRPRQQRESQTLRRSWTTYLLRPAFSTHSSSRLVSDAVVVPPTTRAV